MDKISDHQQLITHVAVIATKLQAVEETLHQGITDVKKFTEKSIAKENEVAIKVNDIGSTLAHLVITVDGIVRDLDIHKVSQEGRLKKNEKKADIALIWLAFLTIFEVALLLSIASGASGARVAGEFTGGLIRSVKP